MSLPLDYGNLYLGLKEYSSEPYDQHSVEEIDCNRTHRDRGGALLKPNLSHVIIIWLSLNMNENHGFDMISAIALQHCTDELLILL